ncbi:hypothetical protein [Halomonas sp. BC2]|uniref:hypothetical protein n=1 Tax=Halomonas sp. BC2 TaxID=1670449 RepID=UPI0009BECBA6|nr:hypothetical protein [Halomonas sp. BC2]
MPSYLLFKFGEKEHMEALINHGELYLQTLGHYADLEHRERGDKYEGVVTVRSSNGGTLKIKHPKTGEEHSIQLAYSQMRESDSSLKAVNVYCLYCLQFEETDSPEIGMRFSVDVINGFGDAAVMIYDVDAFLNRVVKAAEEKGSIVLHRIVQYLDLRDYTGDLGPFRKDSRFSHQNEYRIAVGTPERNGKPIKLNVGSLDGIATLMKSDEIQKLKFHVTEE